MRKIMLILLVLTMTVLIRTETPRKVFQRPPVTSGEYVVSNVYNNQIGNIIRITLRIVTEHGVDLDLSKLPSVGEKWENPDTVRVSTYTPGASVARIFRENDMPSFIDEGRLEILSRKIRQSREKGTSVTEIEYEFQYLDPIDFKAVFDEKMLTKYTNVFQSYWLYFPDRDEVLRISPAVPFTPAVYFMSGQVDKESKPIMTFFEAKADKTVWFFLRIFGFLLIGSVLLYIVGMGLGKSLINGRKSLTVPEVEVARVTMNELCEAWNKSLYYGTFIEAIMLYRKQGTERNFLWWKTTMILYSGVILDPQQIKIIFEELLKEF